MSKILAPLALAFALQSPNISAQEGGVDMVKDSTHGAVVETMKNVEGIEIIPLDDPFIGLSPKEREVELVARKAFNTVRPPLEQYAPRSTGELYVLPAGLSVEQSVSYNARLAAQKATENKRQRALESRYEAGDESVKIVGKTASGDMLYEVTHAPKPIFHMDINENKRFGVGVQPTLQLGSETLQLGVSGTISKDQKNALIALGWQFSPNGVITLSASTGAENAKKAFREKELDGDKNLKARTFGVRLDLSGIGPIARTRLEALHTEVPSIFLGQTSTDTVHIRIEDLPTVINTLEDTTTTTTHYSNKKATHTTARIGGVIEVGESGELSLSLGAVSSHIGAESSIHPSGTIGYTYYGGVDKFEIGARYTGHSTGIDAKYTTKISEGISAFIGGFADKGTNGYSNSGVMVGLSATFGGPDNPTPYARPDSTHPHVEHIVGEVLTDTQYRAQDIASLTHLHKEVEVHTHTTTLGSVSKILALTPANETASTPHNTPITINLLANNTTANPGGVLTIVGTPTVTHGTLTLSGASVTVTPLTGYIGDMVVTYTVSDGKAANITETATISVAAPINQAPIANPDAITTTASTAVSFNPLGNDTDPENNALSLVSATSSNGVISTSGNTVTFTPNSGFTGVANILYTITDGVHQVTGNVQVTVNAPANQAPDAFPAIAPISATAGTAGSQVLSGTTDPNGDTLTYSVSGLPSGFSFDAVSRTLSWTTSTTPGSYNLTLQAADGNGGNTQTTVGITVNAPADVLAPSQTNSTNLGSFTLGTTLSRTLTFDETIASAVISGLPAGVTETHSISGNQVTITLSVDPLAYTFSSATDTIPFTLTVGDGASTPNTRAISESAQVTDVAPSFAAQSDATRGDNGAAIPIIPVTDICPTGIDSFGRVIASCIVTVVNPPHGDIGLSYNAATNAIEGTIDVFSPSQATVERRVRMQGSTLEQTTNSVINLNNNG